MNSQIPAGTALSAVKPKRRRRKGRRKRIEGTVLNSVEQYRRRIATIPHRFIPLDITRELLLRLPVRSLVRFRRVCKLWHSIIRDPHFVEKHLDHSRNTHLPSIIFISQYFGGRHVARIARLDANKPLSLSAVEPYFSRTRKTCLRVTGSCNGLICIIWFDDNSVEVLNPSTGESLTPPKHTSSNPSHVYPSVFFLGYHPATKEYKLVNFFSDIELKEAGGLWVGCEVYTLGTNSWRKIPTKLGNRPRLFANSVSAKGSMFWNLKVDEVSVLRFDLKDEEFSLIPTLKLNKIYRRHCYETDGSLVYLQGSICTPVFPCSKLRELTRMDLWVLNDNENSWTRKYSVTYPQGNDFFSSMPLLIHNDKILEKSICLKHPAGPAVLQYHLLTRGKDDQGSRESLENLTVFDRFPSTFFVHVESLVPLFET